MMRSYCGSCGHLTQDEDLFCARCGQEFEVPSQLTLLGLEEERRNPYPPMLVDPSPRVDVVLAFAAVVLTVAIVVVVSGVLLFC